MIDRLLGWSARVAAVLLVAACGGGGGGGDGGEVPIAAGLDQVAPTVTYATPSNGATGVATDARLTVTFSEPMDEASLGAAITLVDDASGSAVALRPVAFDVMNRIATVTPAAPLAADRRWRAEVSTAARDLAGHALAAAYAWTFTTGSTADNTPPELNSHAPRAGASDIATDTSVAMSFSEPMDVASVGAAFTLTRGGQAVAGTMAYIGQAAVFKPDAPLAPGAVYTATLRRSATDLVGNPLRADVVWAFTTRSAPDTTPPVVRSVSPAPGATNVARESALSVTFDEPIYPFVYGTIDGVLVEVTIDYATNTARMRPTAPLRAGASYEGSARASDLAGNTMDPAYRWSFVTAP